MRLKEVVFGQFLEKETRDAFVIRLQKYVKEVR